MQILFLGYSNVLRRRILPFIQHLKNIEELEIAKYIGQRVDVEKDTSFRLYESYDEGLNKSKADIIYISTVNSAHYELARKAILSGRHVIIDKPAFLKLSDAYELAELAGIKGVGIAEATVYPYHPLIIKTIETIEQEKLAVNNLTVNFSFPPFEKDNFRYRKELGGGALFDLGPYAVSVARIFFRERPEKIICCINDYTEIDHVEISFSLIAKFPGNRSMIGNFGFNTGYVNRLSIFGESFSFEINRVFTPPADVENEIIYKHNDITHIIRTEKTNSFINFINEFSISVREGDFDKFSQNMIFDAEIIHKMRNNLI